MHFFDLEYHQQVIFLTTNHVERLDNAFISRISVAIKYPELDEKAQEAIWEGFLCLGGVEIIQKDEDRIDREAQITRADLRKLAERKMNGR